MDEIAGMIGMIAFQFPSLSLKWERKLFVSFPITLYSATKSQTQSVIRLTCQLLETKTQLRTGDANETLVSRE